VSKSGGSYRLNKIFQVLSEIVQDVVDTVALTAIQAQVAKQA